MPSEASLNLAFRAGLLGDDATFAADLWDALRVMVDLFMDDIFTSHLRAEHAEVRRYRTRPDGEPNMERRTLTYVLDTATQNMARGLDPWAGMDDWGDQMLVRALRAFVVGRKEPKPSKAQRRATRQQYGPVSAKVQPLGEVNRRRKRAL